MYRLLACRRSKALLSPNSCSKYKTTLRITPFFPFDPCLSHNHHPTISCRARLGSSQTDQELNCPIRSNALGKLLYAPPIQLAIQLPLDLDHLLHSATSNQTTSIIVIKNKQKKTPSRTSSQPHTAGYCHRWYKFQQKRMRHHRPQQPKNQRVGKRYIHQWYANNPH